MSRIYPASTITVLQVTTYKLHDNAIARTIKETLLLYWIPMAEIKNKLNASHELLKGPHEIQRRRMKEEVIDYAKSKKRLGSTLKERKALKVADKTQKQKESCAAVRWLVEHNFVVICNYQLIETNASEKAARKMAAKLGVNRFIVTDLRSEFIRSFIFPTIQGNALYEERIVVRNALANTIRAKGAIQLAVEEDIRYISHGNNNSNEYMIFELNFYALNLSIKIIAPWQKPEVFTKFGDSRNMLQYVKEKGIRVPFRKASPCSVDTNLI